MKKIGRNGFTLIEVLIFSAIFGIVVMAIYMMYSTSHTTFTRGQNKIEAQQNGRVAMERMAREIRTAGYDPSDALTTLATTAIQAANANSITFIADVDGDNSIVPDGVPDTDWVRYSLVGNQIIRDSSFWDTSGGLPGVWNPAVPLPPPSPATGGIMADGVRPTTHPDGAGLTFTYFDGSDAAPGSNADVRRITIQLTTEESGAPGTESFPLSMDVRLRNLQ